MKILVCDTSNQNASAGIYEDGKEIVYELSFEKRTHSETFMPLVHRVMKLAKMSHSELDAYAVVVGPGSFTGLRIGSATAKGLTLHCRFFNGGTGKIMRERDRNAKGGDDNRSRV